MLKDRLSWPGAILRGAPWGASVGLMAAVASLYSLSSFPFVALLLLALGGVHRSPRVFLAASAAFTLVYALAIVVIGIYQLLTGPHLPS